MNTSHQAPCNCTTCPDTVCTCGCQQTPEQIASACGPQCRCGAQCQCGAGARCAQS